MALRIAAKMDSVPDAILEEAMLMHPAIDPDTGHMVCHHHEVSAAVFDAGGESIPALLVGSCLAIVTGKSLVSRILEHGNAKPAQVELKRKVTVSETEPEPYWVLSMLSVLKAAGTQAELYTVEVESSDHGRRRIPALRIIADETQETLLLVISPCRRPEEQRPAGALYF